uniref:Phosducin-like protein n=1 Tax=Aceria tosichella TaxID=561515 RepID=A0A6G1SEW8_9ACAR
MSTIEDKILDGPRVHYCDADDDDIRTGEDAGLDLDDPDVVATRNDVSSLFVRPDQESSLRNGSASHRMRSQGYSMNTGPKGVIADHRKHSLSKSSSKVDDSDLDEEFKELLNDDSIIKSMAERRIAQLINLPSFGSVFRLATGSELLDAIDKENPNVLIVVHIYARFSRPCAKVDKCLDILANEFKQIKFVTLDASAAGLSDNFKENGVPALLAYRGGNLVKSLVQLEDLLDKDFEAAQLRELLIDNEIIR